MSKEEFPEDPLCPDCGGSTGWEFQDAYTLGGYRVIKRLQVCHNWCGWLGHLVLFPVPVAKEALQLAKPMRLPEDPWKHAVPYRPKGDPRADP